MPSRFDFFLISDRPFVFLVRRGAVFSNSLKQEKKSDKVKASIN